MSNILCCNWVAASVSSHINVVNKFMRLRHIVVNLWFSNKVQLNFLLNNQMLSWQFEMKHHICRRRGNAFVAHTIQHNSNVISVNIICRPRAICPCTTAKINLLRHVFPKTKAIILFKVIVMVATIYMFPHIYFNRIIRTYTRPSWSRHMENRSWNYKRGRIASAMVGGRPKCRMKISLSWLNSIQCQWNRKTVLIQTAVSPRCVIG